jgi:hypothetical protein
LPLELEDLFDLIIYRLDIVFNFLDAIPKHFKDLVFHYFAPKHITETWLNVVAVGAEVINLYAVELIGVRSLLSLQMDPAELLSPVHIHVGEEENTPALIFNVQSPVPLFVIPDNHDPD